MIHFAYCSEACRINVVRSNPVFTSVSTYSTIFGKNAKQLREEYGLSAKDNIRDHLSEEELQLIQSKEMLVSGLIGCGWEYDQSKDFLTKNNILSLAG